MLNEAYQPLSSKYPISENCPKCGGSTHKKVKPKTAIAFTWDRVCQQCSTRYTPLTPRWARVVFALLGLAFLGLAILTFVVYMSKPEDSRVWRGLLVGGFFAMLGIGCIVKVFTK
jgi:drug/metabolite transporter (DMT)-like permease